jgi:hypothetical protein
MTQTNAGLWREDGFEMDNGPCTDPRIMPNDRTLKNHDPCRQIAIVTNLASHQRTRWANQRVIFDVN